MEAYAVAAPCAGLASDQSSGLVSIDRLRTAWKEFCRLKPSQDIVHNFFKGPGLFLANPHVQFSTGCCSNSGQHDFLLPVADLPPLQQQLEGQLGLALPAPQQLSPPVVPGSFRDVRPLQIKSAPDFWAQLKLLQKSNKQSKQQEERQLAQQALAQAQRLVAQRQPPVVFLSIDLEWFEDDHDRVLELGWSVWDSGSQQHRTRHFIVRENLYTCNRKYVPNNKEYFEFGESHVERLQACVAALQAEISTPTAAAGVGAGALQLALVGHGLRQDLEQLGNLGVVLPRELVIFDTQDLHWALAAPQQGAGGEKPRQRGIALKELLKQLGWHPRHLHNAGNDARWTMEAFLELLAGGRGQAG